MEKKIIKGFFNQSYPYYYEQHRLLKFAGSVMLLCFLIIFLLEPFIVYRPEHKVSYFWICIIHSAVPAMIVYSLFSAVNFVSKREDKWTTGKEMSLLFLLLLLAGSGNFLVRDLIYDNPDNWSAGYLFMEIRNAFIIGSLLIAILVPVNYERLFWKYQTSAESLSKSNPPKPAQPYRDQIPALFIKTRIAEDDFHLQPDHFIMAKAEGNYVEIFISNEDEAGLKAGNVIRRDRDTDKKMGRVIRQLKRIPLKELESQLADCEWIIRVHRSYLVNKERIKDIQGNAMGYQIRLHGISEEVPVSRGRIPYFNNVMRA